MYSGVAASGEAIFNGPVTDGPKSVTVIPAESKTDVTSSSVLNTSVYGEFVTFTATVTSQVTARAGVTLPPRGTVTFFDGSSVWRRTCR